MRVLKLESLDFTRRRRQGEEAANEIPGPASGFEHSGPVVARGAKYFENFSDQLERSLKVP